MRRAGPPDLAPLDLAPLDLAPLDLAAPELAEPDRGAGFRFAVTLRFATGVRCAGTVLNALGLLVEIGR